MQKILFSTLSLFVIFFSGCATTYKLDPQAQKGQQAVYRDGVETMLSKKKANVAVRSSTNTYSSDNRPTIIVSVFNKTNRSFNFSTENIKVFVDGKAHKVFTYDELVDEVKTKETVTIDRIIANLIKNVVIPKNVPSRLTPVVSSSSSTTSAISK